METTSTEPENEEIKDESIFPSNKNDQPTDEDDLGFEPYVKAIAEFLTNESTVPPLVLSIEGEWGSGKSSFMMQLKQSLQSVIEKKRHEEQITNHSFKAHVKRLFTPRRPLTVWFNAWRHDREDALWAAFALQFLKEVSSQRNWFRRQVGDSVLFWRRFKWSEGWLDLLRKSLLSILAIGIIIAIPIWALSDKNYWVNDLSSVTREILNQLGLENFFIKGIQVGGLVTYISFLLIFFKKIKEYFGSPLQIDLQKYLQAPDYANRIAFIEQFHNDFNRIVSAYAGNQKVYVFIDDLDRCDVPKAAELMKALNLMISKDPRLIFIIGMDREKVAAGLAVKHQDLLNYLYIPSFISPISEDKEITKLCGLEYGFDFIEKFVQLPFILPVPTNDNLNRYLISLTGSFQNARHKKISINWLLNISPLKRIIKRIFKKKLKVFDTGEKTELVGGKNLGEQESEKKHRETIKVQVSEDYQTIEKVIKLVAPALDRNPRRIKQFINLFRLRVYIAAETGLFDIREGSNEATLTLEQLGKFVALQLKWPLLLVDLERYPNLIKELQSIALSGEMKSNDVKEVLRWSNRKDLMMLLREGCVNEKRILDTKKIQMISLEDVNFEKLLQISPKVRDIKSLKKTEMKPEDNRGRLNVQNGDTHEDISEPELNKKDSSINSVENYSHGYVFISFAGEDRFAATQLAENLRTDGIDVWMDESSLMGGDKIDETLIKAINKCAVFIPLISENSKKILTSNENLRFHIREWQQAYTLKKSVNEDLLIIPVIIDWTSWIYEQFKDLAVLRIPEGRREGDYEKLMNQLRRSRPIPA